VPLSPPQYADLLAFRTALRRFEQWSREQARAVGLTPAQHQLLLAVKGHEDQRGPTIGQIADYLTIHHHSAVGLTDRVTTAGFVTRVRDDDDARVVRLRLTDLGEQRISELAGLHVDELRRLAPLLGHLAGDAEPSS
jgi:DNA-binding MarR family transcriptional regulator